MMACLKAREVISFSTKLQKNHSTIQPHGSKCTKNFGRIKQLSDGDFQLVFRTKPN